MDGLNVNTKFCVDIHGSVTSELKFLDHFAGQVMSDYLSPTGACGTVYVVQYMWYSICSTVYVVQSSFHPCISIWYHVFVS